MNSNKTLDKVREYVYGQVAVYNISLAREAQKPLEHQGRVPSPMLRKEEISQLLGEKVGEVERALQILNTEGIITQPDKVVCNDDLFSYRSKDGKRQQKKCWHPDVYYIRNEVLRHKDTLRDLKQYKYPVEPPGR